MSTTVASAVFACAGVTSHCRDGVGSLAVRLLGPHSLEYAFRQHAHVKLKKWPDRIVVCADLTAPYLTMAVALGIAKYWSSFRGGLPVGVSEESLAVAIAVPRDALIDAMGAMGAVGHGDIDALASDFVCPREVIVDQIRFARRLSRIGPRRVVGVAS